MKKFELFVGCLGNGLTVCNKAVEENGDYKHLAHIADNGKITWYVNPANIPSDGLEKINRYAMESKKKWEDWFQSMPEIEQYKKLLDSVPASALIYAMNLDGGIKRKIEYLKKVCEEKSYF